VETALAVALAVACALLLLETGLFLGNLAHLHKLDDLTAPDPDVWPSVSVVMAARDEADGVGEAVRSRLVDDYPDLQVILVDDRSTDGTGEAALAAAAGDSRFTLVRVDELPDGWLGKVHAMRQGVEQASGEWLLMSDGDVVVEPGTLRKAIAHCEHNGVDLLAMVPSFIAGSFLIDGVWVVFMRGLIVMGDPAKVRDHRSRVALGAGAYNLVRRSAYEATEGFEHLRMETGDDVALASMVKRTGGQLDLVDGAGHARVAIYRSVGELMRGIEKNGSTTATIPFAAFVLLFVALGAVLFSPFIATVVGTTLGPAWLAVVGLVTFLIYTASEMYGLWRNTGMWAPAIVWPVGFLIMAAGMIRSTWLAHRKGGVTWRGTFYPLDELTEGRRFKL
jgi:cellulose synthase/poly-beta-1,6-N-acetylglucosamine synthase-like glycosyltransferase